MQAWIDAGNTPEAADPAPEPESSEVEVLKRALQTKGVLTPEDLETARGKPR